MVLPRCHCSHPAGLLAADSPPGTQAWDAFLTLHFGSSCDRPCLQYMTLNYGDGGQEQKAALLFRLHLSECSSETEDQRQRYYDMQRSALTLRHPIVNNYIPCHASFFVRDSPNTNSSTTCIPQHDQEQFQLVSSYLHTRLSNVRIIKQ